MSLSPRARAKVARALLLGACSCSPRELPPIGHVVLYIDTDAPVPSSSSAPLEPTEPAPLLATALVELYPSGATAPCDGCSRLFALDTALLTSGASMSVVPEPGADAIVAHVQLFPAAALADQGVSVTATAIDAAVSAEGWFLLPTAPAEGAVSVTAFVSMGGVGAPVGSPAAPVQPLAGHVASQVGTWAGAQRMPCTGAATPTEACVPGGAYWMGNPLVIDADIDSGDHQRLVTLSPFFLSDHEVTVAELRAQLGPSPDGVVAWSGSYAGSQNDDYCTFTALPGPHDDLPINCISWSTAQAYCQALGGALPTEAQFEYAASDLQSSLFVWGGDPPTCADAVWGRGQGGSASEVASYEHTCLPATGAPQDRIGYAQDIHRPSLGRDVLPLGSGVQDLVGNVSEWMLDAFNTQLSSCWQVASPNVFANPLCGESLPDPGAGPLSSVRGGSWLLSPSELAAAARSGLDGTLQYVDVGLRCARSGT